MPKSSQNALRPKRKVSARAGQKEREHYDYITRLLTKEGNGLPLFTNSDLNQPALLEFDNALFNNFNNTVDSDLFTTYDIYNKQQFDQDLRDFEIETVIYTNVCRLCRSQARETDKTKKQGTPLLILARNRIDPGRLDYRLNEPTIVEEMLIARVYI